METYLWYQTLIKPTWAPPAWIFGPVWSVLYVLIALSFGYTLYKVIRGDWPRLLVWPLSINLLANFAFSPIQFGLQNNILALVDILVVWSSLLYFLYLVKRHSNLVFLANLPYLGWVSFATILQITITFLNW